MGRTPTPEYPKLMLRMDYLRKLGVSIADLQRVLRCSRSTLNYLLSGTYHPSGHTIARIVVRWGAVGWDNLFRIVHNDADWIDQTARNKDEKPFETAEALLDLDEPREPAWQPPRELPVTFEEAVEMQWPVVASPDDPDVNMAVLLDDKDTPVIGFEEGTNAFVVVNPNHYARPTVSTLLCIPNQYRKRLVIPGDLIAQWARGKKEDEN